MAIEQQIEADLKQALLGGDKPRASVLRLLKSALQYESVSKGAQTSGLNDEQIQLVLSRELKKRTETAQLYKNASEIERAAAEESEAKIIEKYLPAKLSDDEIRAVVEEEVARIDSPKQSDMGKIIGASRARLGAGADGAVIARIAKELLE